MGRTWVSYKNRDVTSNYKFSTTDRHCEEAEELKELIKKNNEYLRGMFEEHGNLEKYKPSTRAWGVMSQPQNTPDFWRIKRIRFMGRGRRSMFPGQRHRAQYWTYLPYKYATHFDVYVGNAY